MPDVSVRQSSRLWDEPGELAEGSVALAEPQPVEVMLPMPGIVRHRYLEIRSLHSDVITVIEILSPVNKRGIGRQKYESKRLEILESQTQLVEIDLLPTGKPMLVLGYELEIHYRVLVSESGDRPQAQLFPFDVQHALPKFRVPLKSEDAAVMINLKPLLNEIYELSGYDLDIDYRQAPVPKWPDPELRWIEQWLKSQGLT